MATAGKHCQGCGTYLMLSPEQPCPFCNRVNKPIRNSNRYSYNDGLYGQPLQTPAYSGYSFPPLQAPSQAPTYADYYGPLTEVSSPPRVYGDSYYSPPPIAYINSYDLPQQQALPLWTMYNYSYGHPQEVSPPFVYSSPYQQAPQVHEKKRAVLCGVTYKGHKQMLEGSINNVRSMQQLLVNRLGFVVRILTEEESDPARTPTKRNILMALQWLVEGCQSGDSLVFYYAGHGSRVPDENGDEIDGYDEALCPVDYRTAGKMLDDKINDTIVAPLPYGVKLHSIIDTCFSGTLLDLPFLCRINQNGFYMWEDHRIQHTSTYKGTKGGKAICISACDDHQNSGDTTAVTGNPIGALTYSFIKAVESAQELTYGDLLGSMRKKIRKTQQLHGLDAPFESSKSQEPQLSSSTRFEIYSKSFML